MSHHNSHSLLHYLLHSTWKTATVLHTLELNTSLLACQHTEVTVLHTLELHTSLLACQHTEVTVLNTLELNTSLLACYKTKRTTASTTKSWAHHFQWSTTHTAMRWKLKFWCFTIQRNESVSPLEWHSSVCYNTQKTMHWKLWTELWVWHNTTTVLTNQRWACQFDKPINVTLKPVTKVDKWQFQSKWTESQLSQYVCSDQCV